MADAPKLDRRLMEQLMFGAGRVHRFTQDSPVLPDVWLQYMNEGAAEGDADPAVKLLLTPFRETGAGDVRRVLHQRLVADRAKRNQPKPLPRVIYNQTTVAATLDFEDLVRIVMPMTEWWERMLRDLEVTDLGILGDPQVQEHLAGALCDPEHRTRTLHSNREYPPDLLWLIRIVGAMALVRRNQPLPAIFGEKDGVTKATKDDWYPIVAAVAELIADLPPLDDDAPAESGDGSPVTADKERARIYSVSLNRQATPTVSRSTLAIKADAARRLFNISCSQLAWAIIDSGVDAHHPAFRARYEENGHSDIPFKEPFEPQPNGKSKNQTRVIATYDFTQIDLLLDPADGNQPDRIKNLRKDPAMAAKVDEALDELNKGLSRGRTID